MGADTVLVVDSSYLGNNLWLMLFRCVYHNKNIHWIFVNKETIENYLEGIKYLKMNNWNIKAIVCDGKKGMFNAFNFIPIQMCQYHQTRIINRYLTQNPKLESAKELKLITHLITKIQKVEFIIRLDKWYTKWQLFLNEKTINPLTMKQSYKHRRIRSAYRSFKTNLPYLFTFQDYPDLFIPNTTNNAEGVFSDLKKKLNVHTGLNINRRIKFINEYLA